MTVTYKRINITIHPTTLEKLIKIAEQEQRSISNMISHLVEQYKEK